jgi:hypothetical protein
MQRKALMKKWTTLGSFIVSLALFSACATHQTVTYKPIIDKTFDSVPRAEITPLSAEQLQAQGYVKIGEIYAEQVTKECYDTWLGSRLSDCSEQRFDEQPTAALLKQAAKKGGQLVLLTMNNGFIDREATRNTGICERERMEQQYVNRPISTLQGYKNNYVLESRRICEHYKQVKGVQTVKKSAGSVWRKGE